MNNREQYEYELREDGKRIAGRVRLCTYMCSW